MKNFITILLVVCNLLAKGQPTTPVLMIETGMHFEKCYEVSIDAAGKYLLSGSRDKTARLWDAATGKLLNTFRVPLGTTLEGRLYSCCLSPDGEIAALAGNTGSDWDSTYCIYLVNTQTGKIIHRITGLPDLIYDLKFSPDGKWLVAGLIEGNGIRIFDTGSWLESKKITGCGKTVSNIAFKPDGGMAVSCDEGKISIYDNRFELITEKNNLPGKVISSIAFNPAGNLLAIGYLNIALVEVRNTSDLSLLYSPSVAGLGNPKNKFDLVCFSADGAVLYGVGSVIDSTGKYILRIWKNEGNGSFTDLAILENSNLDIKPLPNGAVALVSFMPDITVISSSNEISWYRSSPKLELNIHDRSHFRINEKGNAIGFTAVGKDAYSFNVPLRKLLQEKSGFPTLVTHFSNTTVTNWLSNDSPAINGKRVLFIPENETCRSADINSSGQQIILGTDRHLYLSDTNANVIWKNSTGQSAWAVNISGNDKVVAATMSDGTIRWYNMADGKELLAFYLHSDMKRWVLFTPSGYYDASAGAEELLGWHVNNGPDKTPNFYPVSRFREKFYRPDIIDAVLETLNETEAITQANKRKGIKDNSEVINDITKKPPPVISISSPANGAMVNNNMVSISYSLTSPADAPVKNIKVLVNGRPVATERGIKILDQGNQKINVNIPQEDCTITLLADNDNGTSPEANLSLKWKAPEIPVETAISKPNLYVLAIGISKYDKDEYRLGFAAKDAKDFSAALLLQKGRLYNNVFVKNIMEKEASKTNILNGLQWIEEKTTGKDIAIIFFAGHGINDNNGVYYMLPVDADVEHLRSTCINFEEIKQIQSTIQGKVVVFIDACHSGNVMGSGGTYINGLVNLLTSTVKGAGAITFTSSTGKEFSLEDPAWGNGAFTKALIEGIAGAASVEDDKEITYTSLSLYISRRVKKLTNDKQHPTLVPTPNTPDFPIATKQ